ncbi:MAG: nucleotide sugar dehydrogenase [Candidatus Rokubacteria bacterium]|nr:nucleotide sugar dehydrogenase [Candidatus Rokubacteria bacterium]
MSTQKAETIAVIGLGYVGLPLACAFGQWRRCIGFDISTERVAELQAGYDRTGEMKPQDLEAQGLELTTEPATLGAADIIIVAVPTPVDEHRTPDLGPLRAASRTVGRHMARGAVVVFESTVYPGATEEVCQPILEQESGMRAGADFFLGYSPERINPGDPEHSLERVVKVVAGQTPDITERLATVYGLVVKAGVHRAPTIRTAEAAKVIENTQRDLNIALVNELAMIFHRMGIDTNAVLAAAGTKWNFLAFRPGLVGGHCIGVDPYYLTFKAEELGYHPQVILSGRRINDQMGVYVAEQAVKLMIRAGKVVQNARVLVLGLTFKENVPDIRNTRVADLINELRSYEVKVDVYDPRANASEVAREIGLQMVADPFSSRETYDAVIISVAHDEFRARDVMNFVGLLRADHGPGVIVDVQGMLRGEAVQAYGASYWRL